VYKVRQERINFFSKNRREKIRNDRKK